MKKIHMDTFLSFLPLSLRKGVMAKVNPNATWRMIIAITMLAIIGSAALGFYFYKWVSVVNVPLPQTKPEKDAMSADEIRDVVTFYQAKESKYVELLKVRPVAPRLEKGVGVDVNLAEVSSSSELVSTEEGESATTTPAL